MKELNDHASADNIAGSEMVLLKLLRGLPREVERVVLLPEEGIFSRLLEQEGFRVIISPQHALEEGIDIRPLVRSFPLFTGVMRKERPQLVHTTSASPVQYAWSICRLLSVPLACQQDRLKPTE